MSAPRWGLSARDWHAHAVDEHARNHPCGVWVAPLLLPYNRVSLPGMSRPSRTAAR